MNECDENASCEDLDVGYTCKCKKGFDGNGRYCEDKDECDFSTRGLNNCSPQATCVNTIGSFNCSCIEGYEGDGVTCIEVDECDQRPCHKNAQCVNTPGSFNCSCNEGFFGDGFNCTSKFNSFGATPIAKKNVRKVAERKTVLVCHNQS